MGIPKLCRSGFFWLPVLAVGLLLAWSFPSVLIAKKVIAMLMMPCGLVWLAMLVIVGLPGMRASNRAIAASAWVLYTVAGNAWVGAWLIAKLEAPYAPVQSSAEPFDAICVLGGGSSATPDGVSQLGPAGDRLMVPARLYLTGKTRHLVASGLNVTDINGSRSLADDTFGIWADLGIPESAVTRLSEPRTTSEEIRAYKETIAKNAWKRVGVCSSAWHMRRVMSVCRKEGIDLIPVPADFLSVRLPVIPLYAVPQARGFQNVQKALWEFLGGAVGG